MLSSFAYLSFSLVSSWKAAALSSLLYCSLLLRFLLRLLYFLSTRSLSALWLSAIFAYGWLG